MCDVCLHVYKCSHECALCVVCLCAGLCSYVAQDVQVCVVCLNVCVQSTGMCVLRVYGYVCAVLTCVCVPVCTPLASLTGQ